MPTPSVKATGHLQRAYSVSPEKGVLTTVQPPAWAPSVAYVRDPTNTGGGAPGTNRVTNSGNLYQCRLDHTSALATQPTGTVQSTQWTYVGAAPQANNVLSGSIIVAAHAGARNSPLSELTVPWDVASGTYSPIELKPYSAFTQWGLGIYRRTAAVNARNGFSISAAFSGTSPGSGAGEECSIAWCELSGVIVQNPHTSGQVERTSPTGGTVSGPTLTLTKPCIVISIWGGSGAVITAGTSHTAVPVNMTLIPGMTAIMSITANGYIQMAAAWAIVGPGTFTPQWTTTEGAILLASAWEYTPDSAGTIPGVGPLAIGNGSGGRGRRLDSTRTFNKVLPRGGGKG